MLGRIVEGLVPGRLGGPFRWLLAASWATNLADGLALAAGPLLVASLTDDAFLVSLAALLGWAPQLLFSVWAGVLSDRADRRRLLVTANVARVAVLALLILSMSGGTVSVAVVLTALGLVATAEVFVDNTSATLPPMLVTSADLGLANSRLMAGFATLNQLAGPPLGAALFAAGYVWPFVGQALLIGAGAVLVARIALPTGDPRTGPGGGRAAWHDVVEGFRWTWHHPAVRTLALTILTFNVTYGAAWSVLVLYAQDRLGLGAVGFGLLTTAGALGGLVGIVGYAPLTARVSLGNVMRGGLVVETLTHLVLALTTSPAVALAMLFVFGAHAFVWGVTSVTVRQRAVPTELQGRVAGVYVLAVYGGLVVGAALGGALAQQFGVTAPYWFGFAGSAVLVAALWREFPRIAH